MQRFLSFFIIIIIIKSRIVWICLTKDYGYFDVNYKIEKTEKVRQRNESLIEIINVYIFETHIRI